MSENKTITIRGVNSQSYDMFAEKIKNLGITMGDAMTKMIEDISQSIDEELPKLSVSSIENLIPKKRISIEHIKTLRITKKDLLESKSSIGLSHIKELIIDQSVDYQTFIEYISNISHCNTVYIPKIAPKLILLSKISFVSNLVVYDESLENVVESIKES
jgi:hypothetical protein